MSDGPGEVLADQPAVGGRRRRRRDAGQWQGLIEEQQASGLSVSAFCDRHGLAASSFHAWRRRWREDSAWAKLGATPSAPSSSAAPRPSPVPSVPLVAPASASAPRFVRLDPADPGPRFGGDDTIAVRFDCGATLQCSGDRLAELVRLLAHGA